jgi:hypothetical protein
MLKDSARRPVLLLHQPGRGRHRARLPGAPLVIALARGQRRHLPAHRRCGDRRLALRRQWACTRARTWRWTKPVKSEKHTPPVNDERHCRGALRTDADGIAEFRSIYPGYYVERAIHIHFKVHIGERAFLTNQALLPEADNAAVMAMAPYNLPRKGPRISNAQEATGAADDEDRRAPGDSPGVAGLGFVGLTSTHPMRVP